MSIKVYFIFVKVKDLTNRFAEFVRKKQLFYPEDLLIIAVSGGVDSVVLFNLCKQSGFRCVIAHCNFQLRGGESLRDEAFVKELAESHEVELFLKRFDTGLYAIQNQVSVQMAARELRYQWFEELRSMLSEERGVATYILTAHHGDDNVETVLMNFFKGTGISGMHGILPKAGKLVRPLLFASKKDIERHAVENNLFFVEDSSNAEDNYSRNYIRHQIIPRLTVSYPGFYDNMMKNIDRFTQVELLYNQAVGFHKKKLLEERNNEVYIPVNKLRNASPLETIIYEIIRHFGFTSKQTEDVLRLLVSETGRFVYSPSHRILRNRDWLVISQNESAAQTMVLVEDRDKEVTFEGGKLQFEIIENRYDGAKFAADSSVALLDLKGISFPLIIRKWKPGDYFYPLGMQKKKKLSRFLIDMKLSKFEKERVWIIEMDKRIIWIINRRIDDRFKVTPGTKKILKIELKASQV